MLSQMHNFIQSWWQRTPLPNTTATPSFQQWHRFDEESWMPFVGNKASRHISVRHQRAGSFRLVSWNANADASFPIPRMSALLQVVENRAADVIFLQEVSSEALTVLLKESWIQRDWYISDTTLTFTKQKFISITLVSHRWISRDGVLIGAVWRVLLPSRFGRDALCCDLILNSSSKQSSSKHTSGKSSLRIRLINVHLDSLPINPSLRPGQLSISASYLSAAGQGIIAGDFNSVLPEDDNLIRNNNLVDAWTNIHPDKPGYTWGVHSKQGSFPPNRLDRVAVLNLIPVNMGILQTSKGFCGEIFLGSTSESIKEAHFSDHLGVWCDIGWSEE